MMVIEQIDKTKGSEEANQTKSMPQKKLLSPKIDYVFKRIFSHKGSEEITKDLLNSILNYKISSLELDTNPILDKDLLDDKVGILDIKAKIDNSITCNIEMQIVDRKNIEKRILFYWSKLYSSGISSGEDYSKLEKTIVILFLDYELKTLKDVKKYFTKWNLREENYSKIILTDILEIYIIELPKFNKYKNSNAKNLNSWVKFINNPEVVDMSEENKKIKEAKEILEGISEDEHERYLAELRQKYIMDQKAIKDAGYDEGYESGTKAGIEQGMAQGIKQGISQGMAKGISQEKAEIAKKLLAENVDIDFIVKITNLTKEEIEKLKND